MLDPQALQLDKYMVSSAELPEETDGEAVSNGGDATAPQPEPSCSYRLYGCIFHKGQTQNRGHYYAMCRVGPGDDHWCATTQNSVEKADSLVVDPTWLMSAVEAIVQL